MREWTRQGGAAHPVYIVNPEDLNAGFTFVVAASDSLNDAGADYICDGVDDQVTILAAINALPTGGGKIVLLDGHFNFSAQLTIVRSNIEIVGQGRATVIRAAAGSEGINLFYFGDGVSQYDFIRIASLRISSVNQKTGNSALVFNKCFGVWLENLYIDKQYRAIWVLNTHQFTFKSSDVRDTSENGVVIETDFRAAVEWYIEDVWMDNPVAANTGNGIWWIGGEGLYIQRVAIQRFQTGLLISPTAGKETRWGFIEQLLCDTCSDNGIKISNSGTGDVFGITFVDSWSSTNTNFGVFIEKPGSGAVEGIRFIGMKIFNNGLAGMRLHGGCEFHISDSDIMSNSITSSGARHGIEVNAGVSEWSIMGCRIGNGYDHGNSQGYGVYVDVGASDYYNVEHNDLRDNVTGAISDGGTGVNKRIQDNFT